MSDELTAKQKAFVEEYLKDLNATQAAIRAGYSENSAQEIASENLTKPIIQAAVQEAMKARSERCQVTADEVIEELKQVAFARVTDFAEWDETSLTVKPSRLIKNKAGIESIKNTSIVKGSGSGGGDDLILQNDIQVKLTKDKVKALELLGKHLGMFKDSISLSGPVGQSVEILLKKADDNQG